MHQHRVVHAACGAQLVGFGFERLFHGASVGEIGPPERLVGGLIGVALDRRVAGGVARDLRLAIAAAVACRCAALGAPIAPASRVGFGTEGFSGHASEVAACKRPERSQPRPNSGPERRTAPGPHVSTRTSLDARLCRAAHKITRDSPERAAYSHSSQRREARGHIAPTGVGEAQGVAPTQAKSAAVAEESARINTRHSRVVWLARVARAPTARVLPAYVRAGHPRIIRLAGIACPPSTAEAAGAARATGATKTTAKSATAGATETASTAHPAAHAALAVELR